MEKTLHNTDASGAKQNVSDLVIWGDGDMFELLCKASSKAEKWMKSTKAMEIPGVGCVVQVTTQQGDEIAEAVTFVPNCRIERFYNEDKKVTSRRLVPIVSFGQILKAETDKADALHDLLDVDSNQQKSDPL